MGFQEPLFDGKFYVTDSRKLASKHRQLMLKQTPDNDKPVRAILFNAERHAMLDRPLQRVHILYSLETDTFHGRRAASLTVRHIEALD